MFSHEYMPNCIEIIQVWFANVKPNRIQRSPSLIRFVDAKPSHKEFMYVSSQRDADIVVSFVSCYFMLLASKHVNPVVSVLTHQDSVVSRSCSGKASELAKERTPRQWRRQTVPGLLERDWRYSLNDCAIIVTDICCMLAPRGFLVINH